MQYTIESTTILLQPYAHTHYQTEIWDEKGIFYTEKTALQLLNEACMKRGASYRGKRDAVCAMLQFRKNVPIPICFDQQICAIPTASPDRWDCVWYFYAHVKTMKQKGKQTILTFHNGSSFAIDASFHRTQKQLWRSGHILSHFQLTKV